jgi:branched-chain amino acid transport system permease protein
MAGFLNVLVIGLLLGGVYSLVSIGLNLIFGVLRIVNFAQGALVMVGMYATVFLNLRFGLDPALAVFLVAPALFLFGLVLYALVLRPLQREPMMQVFATFGVLIVLQNLVLGLTRGEGYSATSALSSLILPLGPVRINAMRLASLAAALVLTVALAAFLRRTLVGKAVRALIQDRQSARMLGIHVERYYLVTFGFGCALAGVAAALLTPIYTLSPGLGDVFILPAFAVVVLGGLGSITGALIGGLLVGLIESFAGYYLEPSLKQSIWFVILIAALIVRPAGLLGQVGAEEVGLREQG